MLYSPFKYLKRSLSEKDRRKHGEIGFKTKDRINIKEHTQDMWDKITRGQWDKITRGQRYTSNVKC